jgi:DNA polymerase III epsilon subunit-like protein
VPDPEILISVDVEASGPSPGSGSLLAIGACLVDSPEVGFYVELKPIPGLPWDGAAERVHKLDRERLDAEGLDPAVALDRFASWVDSVADGARPILVGFNAPFDWMFVADYFHRFLGRNPFGVSAIDLKSVYLGRHDIRLWADTTKKHVLARYPGTLAHTHNALDDARMQAELARALMGHHGTDG